MSLATAFNAFKTSEAPTPKAPSSKTDNWFTPMELMIALHEEFGFTLDAFGHPDAPASKLIGELLTPDDDGGALSMPWDGLRVFANPPYSPGNLAAAVEKCATEGSRGVLVVALVPAWTDRRWWQDYVEPGRRAGTVEVRFLRGRLRFGWPESPSGKGGTTATFPSALVIWGRQ